MAELIDRVTSAMADRYRIERELGAGGMATVYLAEDVRHRRKVAIKVLHAELSAVIGPERFLKEIELTAGLQHPHILPLFDSGSADGLLFYVMPFVDGETLRGRLTREHQLPIVDALRIATAVADALEYAHKHGVVHRDIKPENILLHEGRPVVADFGIALAVQQAGAARMTQTGMSLGTPQYMAPEQAMGEKTVDHRADIYALGALTYEMLTGDPPFTGSTIQAIVARVLTEVPRPIAPQRKSVSAPIEHAVLTALEKLPADRFASAAEFAAALRPESAVTAATQPVSRPMVLRRQSILPWAIAGIAATVTLILGLRRSEPATQPLVSATLLPPPGEEFMERESFGRFSPDGQRFAFVLQSKEGVNRIWLRKLSDQDATVIPGTDGADAPFWSPDGRSLGFFSRGRLMRVDTDGTGHLTLCAAPATAGGTWGTNGTILFSVEREIRKVPAAGGQCETVVTAPPGQQVRGPSFLPDGRHYLYNHRSAPPQTTLVLGDLAGQAPKRLRERAADPIFVPPRFVTFGDYSGPTQAQVVMAQRFDARKLTLEGEPIALTGGVRTAAGIFAYAASSSGLLAYLPSTGDPGKLETDAAGVVVDSVRLRRTWTHRQAWGRRVVALGGNGLWLYDLDRDVSTQLRDSASRNPIWSPGDSLIVFTTCSLRFYRLRENRDSVLVRDGPGCLTPTDWSRDGRTILLTVMPGDTVPRSEIATYDVATGTVAPLVRGRSNVSEGTLSPDGRWLAYQSDESGSFEIYARPVRGPGATIRVSTQGGRTARWTANGREIIYITPEGWLMSASVLAGAELDVAAPKPRFRAPGWSRRLFSETPATPWDMNVAGDRFIFRLPAAQASSAVLVMNWQSLLEQRQ